MQASVQKTSVEIKQLSEVGDVEMNKPINSVVSEKLNENNSNEGHKDAKNNVPQNINKLHPVEEMSLEKTTVVCEKENDDHQFSVVSIEVKTITTDVSQIKHCQSIPKHADKLSPEYNASVGELNQSLLTSFDEIQTPEKKVKQLSSEDQKNLLKQNPKNINKEASVQKTFIEQNEFPQFFDEKNNKLQDLVETVRVDRKLSSKSPKDAQKRNSQCVSIQASVQKTSVEKNQFPQICDVEMNKPINLVVSEIFNENNSCEDNKDAKNNVLQNINKLHLVEEISLYCEKENEEN